jgi:hypothetical protein
MSAWLRRARASIAAYRESCGGDDMLTSDTRLLINRAARLVDRLEQIELLGDVLNNELANSSADARALYFSTACALRFLLGVITKRQARAVA